jgi:hypothetical protein
MLPVLCQEKGFPHLVSGITPVEALADRKKKYTYNKNYRDNNKHDELMMVLAVIFLHKELAY